MREIKFKLLDKDKKVVGYERWCHKGCRWEYSTDNITWSLKYIPHKFKMQFTGLYDSTKWEDLTEKEREEWTLHSMPSEWKGREIYENSVVEYKYLGKKETAPIVYQKFFGKCVGLRKGKATNLSLYWVSCYSKVIGTIHDEEK